MKKHTGGGRGQCPRQGRPSAAPVPQTRQSDPAPAPQMRPFDPNTAPQMRPYDPSAAPQMRRYVHPIVPAAPRRDGACPALQDVLCALAGQNQVLCAMKSELDEILALLQNQAENGAS